MIPTTTLDRIRAHSPCESGYKKLCKGLGGIREYGEDTPITVRQIVEINGLDDALWCLRTMPEQDARWRLLAERYARRVQHLMPDQFSLEATDVAERHAFGLDTGDKLADARIAAGRVAEGSRIYARVARAAGEGAAELAARLVTRLVAHAAARASGAAARNAAWDAEHQWQAEELIRISEEEL